MTAQAIGSLFVALGLDTAAFSAGIKQAQGRIQTFAAGLNKKLGAFGDVPGVGKLQAGLAAVGVSLGAAAGAAAGAAVVGMGALSISTITAAKELKNLSALANATPEEFQKIAYAGQQVGISQEKMADILKDMNDRVGDFIATGGGPMVDFFERIAPKVGVTAEQFRKLSGPQAMQLYVDSLEKANVNQQDFTFFMEAMASDSTALVPLLRNGGKAAQEYADRLEALGGVMDNATVARLAGMKTALTEVGVVIGGLGTQIGAAFAPVIQSLAQMFVALFTRGSLLRGMFDAVATAVGWVAQVFAAVVNITSAVVAGIWHLVSAGASWINEVTGIGAAIKWVWDHSIGFVADMLIGFSDLITATGGIGGAFALLGEVAAGVWVGIVESAKAIPPGLEYVWQTVKAGFISMIASIAAKWADFLHTITGGLSAIPGAEEAAETVSGFAIKAGSAVYELQGAAGEAKAAADSAAKSAAGALSSGFGKAQSALDKLKATTTETTTAMDGPGGLGAGLEEAGAKGGGAAEKLTKLQEVMKSLREELAKAKATFGMTDLQASIWSKQREAGVDAGSAQGKEISGIMTMLDGIERLKDATADWRDSIKGAFASFVTGATSFKDMLGQIIGKFAEMLANAAFDNLFGAMGGSGLLSGALGWFGIGANANGTNNWRGGLTQVNERGGEIMNLPRGTQIIPHDVSKRMADSARAAQNVNMTVVPSPMFDVVVDGIARGAVSRAAPAQVAASVRAVANASRKSKSFLGSR